MPHIHPFGASTPPKKSPPQPLPSELELLLACFGPYLDADQARQALHCGRSYLNAATANGRLKCRKVGGKRLFSAIDIYKYIEKEGRPNTHWTALSQRLKCTSKARNCQSKRWKGGCFFHMDSIQSVDVKWLWYPYLPKGKIILLEADPGTGKTFLTLWVTAVITSGGHFFMEPNSICRAPANVVYQSEEDGLQDTIKPRLEKMNPIPDMHRITGIWEDKKSLTLSDERIEMALQKYHPVLLVIDPLQNYIGAAVDMHRANEVRPILARIARLADKYQCTFLFVMHLNKNSQGSALYRALGNIDIPAIARSMLYLGSNPKNDKHKILCHEKSSLSPKGESLTFTINPDKGCIIWDGVSRMHADDILRAGMLEHQKPSATLDDAVQRLRDLLGEEGATMLEQVETLQEESGISQRTIYNAKSKMQLQTIHIGRPPHRQTWWLQPDLDVEKFKLKHLPDSEPNVIELHPEKSTPPS